ncbi:hypothetical protein [Amycolatopsis magusensis]|uniref:hypothetical protein n=1 Tax=Amycolatopsis magusensis TaxID=882444 RepID=UPI0024A95EB2|nr:hypothetical protein [Amycolatopsis magusensis]MDI5975890.1 hypothetical protein [Amycolatopsis magusensis]
MSAMPEQRGKRLPAGELVLLVAVLALLAAGGLARWAGSGAEVLWAGATAVAIVPAAVWVTADLRAGRWGTDLLAVLALASCRP